MKKIILFMCLVCGVLSAGEYLLEVESQRTERSIRFKDEVVRPKSKTQVLLDDETFFEYLEYLYSITPKVELMFEGKVGKIGEGHYHYFLQNDRVRRDAHTIEILICSNSRCSNDHQYDGFIKIVFSDGFRIGGHERTFLDEEHIVGAQKNSTFMHFADK